MKVEPSQDSLSKSKVQRYNLMVTIIEASNLVYHGMLTQVKIKFGNKSRKTGVKAGTDSPYYNEFFVFSFKGNFDDLVNKMLSIDVYRPFNFWKPRKLIGSARFDLSTIWIQPDHAIVQKWIVLTHPQEPTGSTKGYLKCNIAILPPGTTVKKPLVPRFSKTETGKDFFVPEYLGAGKLKALYIIKIYKIIGLCKGKSLKSKKHKCYVKINYAGLSGTTTSKNLINNECLWNEEITFTEVFPPFYNRLKIDVYFRKRKICSRYINLREISEPAVKGFLPTYGPAHIHLYKPKYNYVASLLIAIETKTAINLAAGQKMVAVKTSKIINLKEEIYWKMEEFSVFGLIMDLSMLNKKIKNKNRLSISMSLSEDEKCPNGCYSSCSNLVLRQENSNYYIDINDQIKPTLFITKSLPDLRHRLFISNALKHVCKKLRNGLEEAFSMNEHVPHKSEIILKDVIDQLKHDCSSILKIELHAYTQLQKERIKIIHSSTANALKAISKSKFNGLPFIEKFKMGVSIYKALRKLINDPQDDFPYLVIKLKYGKKLLAFKNKSVKDILFSTDKFEKGVYCGRINCIFLTLLVMQVEVVSSSSNKAICVIENLTQSSTIGDIKQGIYKDKKNLYPDRQALRTEPKGKALKDDETLLSLGIRNGGRLFLKDLGPQIGWTTVFLAEYAGPLVIYLYIYQRPWIFYGNTGSSSISMTAHIAAACYTFHYAKRLFETLFIHRFSHSTMPFMNLFKNCSYYWLFTAFVAYHVNHPLYTSPGTGQVFGALVAFLLSEVGNLSIHIALRDLRPPGTKERKIPKPTGNPFTILFNYVSCPNYTYEFYSWLSFAVMTQCIPAGLFAFAGLYQMSIWALGKHKNYKKEFENYPRQRKAILPFIL